VATDSTIRGNVLVNPTTKAVKVGKEEKQIVELRIMSDVYKQNATGELEQDEAKTHPVQLTIWNETLGKSVASLIRKGMRVVVEGQTYQHLYRVSDAERSEGKQDFFEMRCDVSNLTLALNRVESINMRQRSEEQAALAGA
jgi:single-stranded DNA-binding protein